MREETEERESETVEGERESRRRDAMPQLQQSNFHSILFNSLKNRGRFCSIRFMVVTVGKPLKLSSNWDVAGLSSSISLEIVWYNNINK